MATNTLGSCPLHQLWGFRLELEIRREQSGVGTLLSPMGSSATPGCWYLGEKISLVKKKSVKNQKLKLWLLRWDLGTWRPFARTGGADAELCLGFFLGGAAAFGGVACFQLPKSGGSDLWGAFLRLFAGLVG